MSETPDPRSPADEEYCYLTTTGRKSGRAHEVEIWFALTRALPPEYETLYLLSGAGEGSDWVKNLRNTPGVWIRLSGRTLSGRARVIEDPEEDELARSLLVEKYEREPGGLANWRQRSLPVAVDLQSGERPGSGIRRTDL